MKSIKQLVAAAWYIRTGIRFKGRIHTEEGHGRVRTPYGEFPYRLSWGQVRFYSMDVEAPYCPLLPEVVDAMWEDPEGELQYEGPALPRIPIGYKTFAWVNGVAIATRSNNTTIVMGNQ